MGMMWMGFMMVLGIAAVIIISLLVITAVSRVTASRFNHEPLPDDIEKPKRSRLILSDDGELVEILDDEQNEDDKLKRKRDLRDAATRFL